MVMSPHGDTKPTSRLFLQLLNIDEIYSQKLWQILFSKDSCNAFSPPNVVLKCDPATTPVRGRVCFSTTFSLGGPSDSSDQ